MGPNKFIHLTFAAGGFLLAFLLAKAGDWVWSYFAKPSDLLVAVSAVSVAAMAAVIAYRNERAFAAVADVTRELEKVTWPTRKETYAATIVCLVTVLLSALILSTFDAIWSKVTTWFLS